MGWERMSKGIALAGVWIAFGMADGFLRQGNGVMNDGDDGMTGCRLDV